MDSVDIRTVQAEYRRVTKMAETLTYGTLVLPYKEDITWPARKATRATELEQWVIDGDRIVQDAVEQFSALRIGEAKTLIAGTGAGKSTRMPYEICAGHSVNGLVLLPTNALAYHVFTYVIRQAMDAWGNAVRITLLRSDEPVSEFDRPTLYFAAASDFLGRLARSPGLHTRLKLGFVYLDESHEAFPSYWFMKQLLALGEFNNTRVFYGTATGSDVVSMEHQNRGRKVITLSERMFPLGNPSGLAPNMPMHHSKITASTMIFLPGDKEINAFKAYYEMHDIPVLVYCNSSSSKDLITLQEKSRSLKLFVLLTTSLMQTGYTVDVTNVIDPGVVDELQYDMQMARVHFARRNVTEKERVQRAGRVGRIRAGTVVQSDCPPSPNTDELAPEKAIYIYLWSIVFNIEINEPRIAVFSEIIGEITPRVAAMLLNARMPPYLLIPYLAKDGYAKGWARGLKYLNQKGEVFESTEDISSKVQDWPEYNTGPAIYVDKAKTFRSRIDFPEDWYVVPYVAWYAYTNATVNLPGINSARSIISAATERSAVTSWRDSRTTVAKVRADQSVRPLTLMSMDDLSHARFSALQSTNRQPVVPEETITPPQSPPSVYESVSRWREEVVSTPRSPRSRRVSIHARSDVSSTDQPDLVLKQVDPKKHRFDKFYPMDADARETYLNRETPDQLDYERYNQLVNVKAVFSALGNDQYQRAELQRDFFVSLVRVHNTALGARAQGKARVGERRFFGSRETGKAKFDQRVNETAVLLYACHIESFFVGIDVRSRHAMLIDENFSPSFDHDEAIAQMSLMLGNPDVRDKVQSLANMAVAVRDAGRVMGSAWLLYGRVYTPYHVVIRDDKRIPFVPEGSRVVHQDESADVYVYIHPYLNGRLMPRFRPVNDGEEVYVVAIDPCTESVTTFGVYHVYGDDALIMMDKVLANGYSGSLVVALRDGAVLGMYVGYFDSVGGVQHSRVTALDVY